MKKLLVFLAGFCAAFVLVAIVVESLFPSTTVSANATQYLDPNVKLTAAHGGYLDPNIPLGDYRRENPTTGGDSPPNTQLAAESTPEAAPTGDHGADSTADTEPGPVRTEAEVKDLTENICRAFYAVAIRAQAMRNFGWTPQQTYAAFFERKDGGSFNPAQNYTYRETHPSEFVSTLTKFQQEMTSPKDIINVLYFSEARNFYNWADANFNNCMNPRPPVTPLQ